MLSRAEQEEAPTEPENWPQLRVWTDQASKQLYTGGNMSRERETQDSHTLHSTLRYFEHKVHSNARACFVHLYWLSEDNQLDKNLTCSLILVLKSCYLADLAEARRCCSINTNVIYSVILFRPWLYGAATPQCRAWLELMQPVRK